MKKSKKILALLLAVIMIATAVPMTVFATTSGDWEYYVKDDGTASIDNYNGSAKEVKIPSDIDGYKVTGVVSWTFSNCVTLESVTIPDGVTSGFGYGMFEDCSSLREINVSPNNTAYSSVDGVLFNKDKTELKCYPQGKADKSYNIPNGVTSIADRAFEKCTLLENVFIPNSVKTIGFRMFVGCTSLQNVTIENGVTEIDSTAFEGCTSLERIVIPNSVTVIGYGAFGDCTSLNDITLSANITNIGVGAFDNTAYYNTESNWENGVLYLDKVLLKCKETVKEYTVKTGTRIIADDAFRKCSTLENVIIPNSVIAVGERSFYECSSLKEVKIPDSVTSLGRSAFGYCTSLENVTIGNGVKNIEYETFENCKSLKNVMIGNNVTSIGWCAFAFCQSLERIIIPQNVTVVDALAFLDCSSLKDITISDNISDIDSGAFSGTAFYNTESNWENGMLYLENYLLEVKGTVETCIIKEGTKIIASQSFSDCSKLESIKIPDSVTHIGEWAFNRCSSLTSIEIGKSVASIGSRAFFNCNSLKSVTIPKNVTEIGECAFGWTYEEPKILKLFEIETYGGGEEDPIYKIPDFTIYGEKGTEAEKYAKNNEFKFIEGKPGETLPGDISSDGVVSADDAVMIQRHVAGLETLGEDQLKNADLNGDSVVDEGDAVAILRIDAGLAS